MCVSKIYTSRAKTLFVLEKFIGQDMPLNILHRNCSLREEKGERKSYLLPGNRANREAV